MITVLGALFGLLGSIVPDLLKIFQDGKDKKHELTLLKMQMEANKQGHIQKLAEIDMQADIADSTAVHQPYQPVAKILHAGEQLAMHWVDALNATVRPVIAYSFMAGYLAIKWMVFSTINLDNPLPWQMTTLWGEEDQAIFAGVIAFYFGQRAMQKVRSGK